MVCQIQYKPMQRKQYLKTGTLTRRHIPCIICDQINKSSSSSIPLHSRILVNKYKHPIQKIRQMELITHLITSSPPSVDFINYKYVIQQTRISEQLIQYRSFQSIVALIKPLIIERTSKDVNPIISFHSPNDYEAMMKRYRLIRMLKKKKPQFISIFPNILPKNGSGTSTDEDLYSSPSKSNKRRPNQQQNKPPETEMVHRMTRNLSNMLRKYDQNQQFHPSQIFDLIDSVPGHVLDITELEKQFKFKRDLLENFSIIEQQEKLAPSITTIPGKSKNLHSGQRLHTGPVERLKTEPMERLQTDPCCMEDNHYGFKNRGNVGLSRNVNKVVRNDCKKKSSKSRQRWLKQNQSPNVRVHTDYDCQIIRKEKKRSINSKQLSKGVSPSLKSIGRSKDKQKSTVNRSKLSKKY